MAEEEVVVKGCICLRVILECEGVKNSSAGCVNQASFYCCLHCLREELRHLYERRKMKSEGDAEEKSDSFTISFSVSFPTTGFNDIISLFSSILLLCFSFFSSRTLTCNRKSHPEDCKNEVIIPAETESSSSCTSTSLELPDDGWLEVLCRLPLKDVVRFKLVSKSWNSLISHVCIPKITAPLYGLFVPSGLPKRLPRMLDFACCVDGTGINKNAASFIHSYFRTLPFTPSPQYFFDSCNGFLLFFDIQSFRFYVCNPSTQQYLALPRAPEKTVPGSACLTFTPHLNVVWIINIPFHLVIYTSKTRKWTVHRELDVYTKRPATCCSRGVLVNGLLYFLITIGYILELDTQNIDGRIFKLPKEVNITKGTADMGCIGLSCNYFHYAWVDRIRHQLFVWMRNDNQWVLKHSFSLLDLTKYSVPGISENLAPLAPYSFHPTSDVLFLGHETAIFRYDPVSKKLDCIYRLKNGTSICYGQVSVHPFMQSLITMNRITPRIKKKQKGVKNSAARAT